MPISFKKLQSQLNPTCGLITINLVTLKIQIVSGNIQNLQNEVNLPKDKKTLGYLEIENAQKSISTEPAFPELNSLPIAENQFSISLIHSTFIQAGVPQNIAFTIAESSYYHMSRYSEFSKNNLVTTACLTRKPAEGCSVHYNAFKSRRKPIIDLNLCQKKRLQRPRQVQTIYENWGEP